MLTALLLALVPATAQPQNDAAKVLETYHAAHAAGDAELMGRTWAQNPGLILSTFDSDLEAGLAAWEKSGDEKETDKLFERALWSARIASEVSGHPIFADYASSFCGWNEAERKSFRMGQKLHGDARKALKEGKAQDALNAARECRTRASMLGDWWGTAMGYSAEGKALAAMGRHAKASAALGQARLLYSDLGLTGSEYGTLRALIESLVMVRSHDRAHRAVQDALRMAQDRGDEAARLPLLETRIKLERELGMTDAAGVTRKMIEALKKQG